MNVGQLMSRQLRTCRPEESLNDAARIMWEEDCGCVPVVQNDDREHPRLVGIVTDRDVCMAAYTQGRTLETIPVTSVMQRDLATCVATDPVGVALAILRTRQLHRLPVVAGDSELVGLLSLADLARESKREASQLDHPVLTVAAIGDTIAVISETRDAGRAMVATE